MLIRLTALTYACHHEYNHQILLLLCIKFNNKMITSSSSHGQLILQLQTELETYIYIFISNNYVAVMIAGEQFFLTNKEKRNTHDYNIKNNLKILVGYIDKNKKTNLIYMMYSLVWLIVSFCISSYITIFFNEMIFFLNK